MTTEQKMQAMEAFLGAEAWQAFQHNVHVRGADLEKVLDISPAHCLLSAFPWDDTPERHAFWNYIWCRLTDAPWETLHVQPFVPSAPRANPAHTCTRGQTPLMGFWICRTCGQNLEEV